MPAESNRTFALVISGLGKEAAEGCSLCQSKCAKFVWLDVGEQTTASNDWIYCSFKLFRGQIFMVFMKYDQLGDLQFPPSAKMSNKYFASKQKKSASTWQILRPPPSHPSLHPTSMWTSYIYGTLSVCCDMNFFSDFEKITIMWFKQNKPIIKIMLNDTSKSPKLQNSGSLVKVNSISDGILWNFYVKQCY